VTVNVNNQYRPISTSETAIDDGVSVRAINHLADSINNYNRWVGRFPLMAVPCFPEWDSPDNTTDERVVWVGAYREIPDGFDRLVLSACHYGKAGMPSGTTTWRLYCSSHDYIGDVIFDVTQISQDYDSISWVTDVTTYVIEVDRALVIVRGPKDRIYLVLTAENSDNSTRAALKSLSIWPDIA